MEVEKNKKNHWTQTKVDEASKKINQEIYKRNRQAPIQIKLDDLSIYINDRITRRGISKGLVFVQENLNKKLKETHQVMNKAKTKIDTVYHGVPFLGKISYPYGYQKANKYVCRRIYKKAEITQYTDKTNLIEKTNSQIGFLKKYNCRKVIYNYSKLLPSDVYNLICFNEETLKFDFVKE